MIEAGPCPVTAVRTTERDGYEAVQLAFGATKEKHLTKARARAPRRRPTPRRCATWSSSAARRARAAGRRDGHGRAPSRPATSVKVAGTSKGKGFQGTIKRHNFASGPKSHGSHNVRAPGLDRRLGDALARVQGHPRPRADGQQARHPAGPRDRRGRPRSRTCCCVRGSVPGPRNGSSWRCAAMPDAPVLGRRPPRRSSSTRPPSAPRFNGPLVHQSVRAEQAARRRGTAATKTRGDGLRRRRQAVAPEGHRPRPRRLQPLADVDRRWHRLRPAAALLHLQGQPQGAARRAAQRAVAARRARLARGARRRRLQRARRPAGAATCSTDWKPAAARRSSCSTPRSADAALSFRNLARVAVLDPENVGVADLLGAASLLVSAGRRSQALTARAQPGLAPGRAAGGEGLMEHTQVIIRPVVSEKSYVLSAADRYTSASTPTPTRPRSARRSRRCSTCTSSRCGRSASSPSPSAAADARAHARLEEGDRAGTRRREHPSSRACRRWTG